jgi:hypothetical protein
MQLSKIEFDERGLVQQLTALFDAPAYIRRARDVERAYDQLIERCARKRTELLAGVRLHRRTRNTRLRDLRASIARFNRRWWTFLEQLDLTEINRLRDGYNRYYQLEKECAVGSERLASMTFRRLEPVTVEEIRDRFPLLPLP